MNNEDKKGVILIVLSIIIIGIVGYFIFTTKQKNQYDKETFCPLNIPYNQTFIIIDKSDKWDKRKANKIKKIILETKDNLKIHERLTIKVIEPSDNNESIVKTYFDYCNPGHKANPLYQNPKRILKRYKESFEQPLKDLTYKLMQPSVSSNSPILETISSSLMESEGEKSTIYIVSDALENDIFDFYKKIPNLDEILDEYHFPKNKLSLLHIEYIERSNLKDKIYDSLKLFEELASNIGATFQKHRLFTVNYNKNTTYVNKSINNTLYSVCYKDIVNTQTGIYYRGCKILIKNCKEENLKLLIKNKIKINAKRNLKKKCIN